MKNILHALTFISIFCSTAYQAQYTIGEPISVTDGDNSFNYRTPKIAINGNGEPVVLWVKPGSLEAFYFSRKLDSGFTEPVNIQLGGINPSVWSGNLSPDMAASGSHVYVVFEKYGEAIYLLHSGDYGVTWDDPVAAFIPAQGRVATIPNIAVDANDQPYISYVNTNEQEEDAHYGMVKSVDFGSTFLPEVEVNVLGEESEVCECCNGDINIAPNGDVFVAFRNNDDNLRDSWVARSTDGGESFSLAYDMDETDWIANICPNNGPNIMIDNDVVLCAFYTGASDWDNGVYYSTLDINSGIVGSSTPLPLSNENANNSTSAKVAGSGDVVAIVAQESFGNVPNVIISLSTEGPSGLANESFQLNPSSFSQRYPSVAFENNRFHIVYEHSTSGTVLYQEVLVGAESIDELSGNNEVIYPNPTSNEIYITGYDKTVEVTIFDVSGNRILTKKLNPNTSLSLSHLANGIYFAEINDNKSIRSLKVMVQR